MRTLDEVIKAYDICHASLNDCTDCPYDDGTMSCRNCDCYCADAIHYLREYRMMMDDIVAKRKALEFKAELHQQESL